MALDVRVELGDGEAAVDDVAFQLGDVDAIGGEAAERLVERRRHRAHAEHEGGDDRPVADRRIDRLLRHDDEARRRSEEHTSELKTLMRISFSGSWLNKKKTTTYNK